MANDNKQKIPEIVVTHSSDCAIYNAPAFPPGICDCPVSDVDRIAADAVTIDQIKRLIDRHLNGSEFVYARRAMLNELATMSRKKD